MKISGSRLAFDVAVRYLLSPKSHSAINAITLVATFGVVVITAAMVCILSVYNGFEELVRSLTSRIDPDIRIEMAEGRFFHDDATLRQALLSFPDVISLAPILEEQVLLSFSGQQLPAQARGIDILYASTTGFADCLLSSQQGRPSSLDGPSPEPSLCIPGIGLAAALGLVPGMVRPISLYLPSRHARINAATLGAESLEASGAFSRTDLYVADFLRVNQADYDDRLIYLSLDEMQQLMSDSTLVTAYELKLQPSADAERTKVTLNELLDRLYPNLPLVAHTANDLQADAYRIMHIEKWITYLLILFILLIASFNIIGALSMLIIDKETQNQTLLSLGAPSSQIRHIYLWLGLLVSGVGALLGIILGVTLVLLQQHFELITLGSDALYIVSAYPVHLLWPDVVLSLISVLLLGFLATCYTVHSYTFHSTRTQK